VRVVPKLFLKNWRDIKALKAQFIALIFIVVLGTMSFIAAISAYQNLFSSYNHVYERLHFADFTAKVQMAPSQVVQKVRDLGEVEVAEGRLVMDTGLYISEKNQATTRLIGMPVDRHPRVNDVLIEKGRYFKPGERDVCLVEKHFAEYHEKKPGDYLQPIIKGKKRGLKIIGVAASPEYLIPSRSKEDIVPSACRFAVLFVPQNEIEELLGTSDSINEVCVLVKKGTDPRVAIEGTEEILEPHGLIETLKKENQPSNAALEMDLEGYREIGWMMPALILIIASLSLYIALSRLVQAQRGEIGLAKALSYSNRQVFLHYLIFSIIIATIGTTLGLILGQWTGGEITRAYAAELGIPLVKTRLYPGYMLEATFMSFFFCLIAAIVPARASAKMKPAIAMRTDPSLGIQKGSVSIPERILSKLLPLPFAVKIPFRNIFRTRRRSLYTALGIIFALVLTLATWSMFDAMDYMLKCQAEKIERWDMMAAFSQPLFRERIKEIGGWDGVRRVESALILPTKITNHGKSSETMLIAMKPEASFHGFRIMQKREAKEALEERGIILTPFIARKLELEVCDEVKVETPWGDKKFTLQATSEEFLGAPTFIHYKDGLKLVNSPTEVVNAIYLRVDPERAEKIRKDLFEIPGVSSVDIKKNIVADWKELMGLFYLFMGIILLFAFAMAFIVVFNTLTTNILEREREIATMRTLGENRRRLTFMITLENLLLGIMALPMGILLGFLTASGMMKSFQSEMFYMKAFIYPRSYIIVSGIILGIMLLSEIPAIRRVNRLDLARATKVLE